MSTLKTIEATDLIKKCGSFKIIESLTDQLLMIRRSKRDIIIFYLLLILQITDIIPKTSHDIKISIMNQLHLNIIEGNPT